MRTESILALAVSLMAGCAQSTEPVFCTEEFRAGLTVTVVDAADGRPLAEGAVLTLTEGDYTESWTEAFDSTLSGAWERSGTYEVSVLRPSYLPWLRSDVVVTADECHVQTVSLRAELVADLTP